MSFLYSAYVSLRWNLDVSSVCRESRPESRLRDVFEVVRRLTPDEAEVEKRKKANESWRIANKAPKFRNQVTTCYQLDDSQLNNYFL